MMLYVSLCFTGHIICLLHIAFMLATNSHMQSYVLLMHKYDLIILVYLTYLNQSKFQYIYTHIHSLLQPLKTCTNLG